MVLDCYPVLQRELSGTDLVSLVTIGLQTRTQSEGSGLSCCLCPSIALATVACSLHMTYKLYFRIIAPKFKGGCQSHSQQSVVLERDYVCTCVQGKKMVSHSNRQLASVAVNS